MQTTSHLGLLVGMHFADINPPFRCDLFVSSSSLNSISLADAKRSGVKSAGSEGSAPITNSVIPVDYKSFKATWTEVVHINRERWRAKVPKGKLPLGNVPEGVAYPLGTHSRNKALCPLIHRCCTGSRISRCRFKLLNGSTCPVCPSLYLKLNAR